MQLTHLHGQLPSGYVITQSSTRSARSRPVRQHAVQASPSSGLVQPPGPLQQQPCPPPAQLLHHHKSPEQQVYKLDSSKQQLTHLQPFSAHQGTLLPPNEAGNPAHNSSTAHSSYNNNSSSSAHSSWHRTSNRSSSALAELRSNGSSVRTARLRPPLLTDAIKQCRGLDEVQQVFQEFSAAFNHIHTVALLTHLAKVLTRSSSSQLHQHHHQQQPASSSTSSLTPQHQYELHQLLQDLSQLCEEVLPYCSPRELANMAWGFAALGFYSRRLMQLLLGRARLAALKPQELANMAWAVAKLGHDVAVGWVDELLLLSQQGLAAGAFKPQEATNIAWALAVMQRRCLLSTTPPLRSCARVDSAWRAAFCQAAAAQQHVFAAADVSQQLWALAVLGYRDMQQDCLDAALQRAAQLLLAKSLHSKHAATIMWAVSRLHLQQQFAASAGHSHCSSGSSGSVVGSRGLQVFASAVACSLPQLLAGDQRPLWFAAQLLNACSRLQLQLPAAAMNLLLAAAAKELVAAALASRTTTGTLHTASPTDPTASAAVESQGRFSSSQQHRQAPQQRQQQQQWQQRRLLLDASVLLHGLARLSFSPGKAFLELVAASVADESWHVVHAHDALAASVSKQNSKRQWQHQQQQRRQERLLVQAAAVRAGPSHYHQQQQWQQQYLSIRGHEYSLLLWAMAKLQYQPPTAMLRPLKMACLRQLPLFNATDISIMLWALARMHHNPGYTWLRFTLQRFLACIDDRPVGAAAVCNVISALPHLPGGWNQRRVLRRRLGLLLLVQLANAAAAHFDECGPGEMVRMVRGFVKLGFSPPRSWLLRHEQRVRDIGRDGFSASELRALAAARARMRQMRVARPLRGLQQQQQHRQQQHHQRQQQLQNECVSKDVATEQQRRRCRQQVPQQEVGQVLMSAMC